MENGVGERSRGCPGRGSGEGGKGGDDGEGGDRDRNLGSWICLVFNIRRFW